MSASIDNDEYFELMIRNAWHMSGGRGAAANSTCLRVSYLLIENRKRVNIWHVCCAQVLVEYQDGHQEVVEVLDDLGLDIGDIEAIKRKLGAQGVHDIKAIFLK